MYQLVLKYLVNVHNVSRCLRAVAILKIFKDYVHLRNIQHLIHYGLRAVFLLMLLF